MGGTSFLSKEAQSVFIHELTHMYTDVKGYDAIFRNSVKTNSYNARTYALTAYREAAAITVEEQYRRDIGHTSRSEVFNNLGLEPDMIGVNDYGAWPEMIVAPGSEYYGQIQFSNSVTLMQSKLIVQDIIWRSKTK